MRNLVTSENVQSLRSDHLIPREDAVAPNIVADGTVAILALGRNLNREVSHLIQNTSER